MSYMELLTQQEEVKEEKILGLDNFELDMEVKDNPISRARYSVKEMEKQDPNLLQLLEICTKDFSINEWEGARILASYHYHHKEWFLIGAMHVYKELSDESKKQGAVLPKIDMVTLRQIQDGRIVKELQGFLSHNADDRVSDLETTNIELLRKKIIEDYPSFEEVFSKYFQGFGFGRACVYGGYLTFAILKSLSKKDGNDLSVDLDDNSLSNASQEQEIPTERKSNIRNKLQIVNDFYSTDKFRFIESHFNGYYYP